MSKKHWSFIIIIALVFGALGSIFFTRFLIPYLSTFGPFGFLRKLQNDTPIVINRREEIRLDDGVNMIDLVKQAQGSTVTVFSRKGNLQTPVGSGILLTSDGLIVTSREAAAGSDLVVTLNDGSSHPALVRALDPESDLAVVTIGAKDLPVFQFDDSASLQPGQKIFALGLSNREFTRQFASGFVTNSVSNSASLEAVLSTEQIFETFATDAVLSGTFAGGPVINLQGRLVGIIADRSGRIITSEAAQGAMNSYLSEGKVRRPFWGVRYLSLSKPLAQLKGLKSDGAYVVSLEEGSPAKSGLLAGDLITVVNGTDVSPETSFERLANSKSGQVTLKVERNGQEVEVKINVEKR